MNFLLLFISGIFSLIFYYFYNIKLNWENSGEQAVNSGYYLNPISGNFLIESIIFGIIGIVFFILFSNIFSEKKHQNYLIIKDFFKANLKKIFYYIGFILFYISIWLIFRMIFDFSTIILIIILIIFIVFFIFKKSFISYDLLNINTIIFSFFHVFIYFKIFFLPGSESDSIDFRFIDFLNSLLVLASFILYIYFSKLNKYKIEKYFFVIFFGFLTLFLSTYSTCLKSLFSEIEEISEYYPILIFFLSFYTFLFCFLIFNYFISLKSLSSEKKLLRIIGIIFSYFSIFFGISYIHFFGFNYLIFPILIYLLVFNFLIHRKFENYLSLGFCFFIFYYLIFYGFNAIIGGLNNYALYLLLFTFFINVVLLILSYLYNSKSIYDYYLLYGSGLTINLIVTIFYIYKKNCTLPILGLILLYFAIYVFLSYYKTKKFEDNLKLKS